MKTYRNLYGRICSIDNLRLAFRKAKKGKGQRPYVREFEQDLEANLLQLKHELETLAYEPRPLKTFVIRDPKTRVISASHFRDRIVHHALCNIIEPVFDRTFIHDSYASRKEKGTHAALRRFDEFKRRVSCNGRLVNGAKDGNMVIGYVLKCDIRHYFASVDHDVLLSVIGIRIRDENLLRFIAKILSYYDQSGTGKGMPIGSLTSQLFANIYLNELDYFIKHNLRAKHYIRYMDDFVILHKSREEMMRIKSEISGFLPSLKTELHPEKSRIFPLCKGVCFLGYRIFFHHKLLKKSNLKMMEDRLREFKELHDKNETPREKIMQSVESWMAYAIYANSYKTRKRIVGQFNQNFGIRFLISARPILLHACARHNEQGRQDSRARRKDTGSGCKDEQV